MEIAYIDKKQKIVYNIATKTKGRIMFKKKTEIIPEWIVAGLGNPGKEYEATRHNMGFMAIDRLAESLGTKIDRLRFKALTADL